MRVWRTFLSLCPNGSRCVGYQLAEVAWVHGEQGTAQVLVIILPLLLRESGENVTPCRSQLYGGIWLAVEW